MAVKQEFPNFMAKHDFEPDQAWAMATKLSQIGIITAKEFLGYFSCGPTVYFFWDSIPEWKRHGNDLAQMRDMFMTLQDNEADARERENLILDNRVDHLIDEKIHDTLTKVWLSRYGPAYIVRRRAYIRLWAACGVPSSTAKLSQSQLNPSAPCIRRKALNQRKKT